MFYFRLIFYFNLTVKIVANTARRWVVCLIQLVSRINLISGVMVGVPSSTVVDPGIEPQLGQFKLYIAVVASPLSTRY